MHVFSPLSDGEQIGRYRLVQVIGSGGMATVHLGMLEAGHGARRAVAVKVLHSKLATDPLLVEMFAQEVRLTAAVDHPNVCGFVDAGDHDGRPYMVLEHLRGRALVDHLTRAFDRVLVPPAVAARVVCDAARGAHAIHRLRGRDGALLGVTHRDLTPHNLFVGAGGVTKVIDLGVASMRDCSAVTERVGLRGKLAYVAPECVTLRHPIDHRSDVWSLAVVLWQITTGEPLFAGSSPAETLQRVAYARVPRPSELVPDYPVALEEAILWALERDPDRRPSSAAAFADTLEAILYATGRPTGPAQVAEWARDRRRARRRSGVVAVRA